MLALITAVLLALSDIVIQAGVYGVDSITGASIRVISGSLIMIPLGLLAKKKNVKMPSRHQALVLALAGVFGMGFAPIFLVTAIKYIGAVQTSVLTSTSALFAVPISILILGEKLTRRSGLSIVATVIGVTIVLMGS